MMSTHQNVPLIALHETHQVSAPINSRGTVWEEACRQGAKLVVKE